MRATELTVFETSDKKKHASSGEIIEIYFVLTLEVINIDLNIGVTRLCRNYLRKGINSGNSLLC